MSAFLLAGGAGCSAKYAYFSPGKDSAAQKQDAYACEEEAAKYSSEVGKPGKASIIDAKTQECMDARGYKRVKEGAQLDKLSQQAESARLSNLCAERASAVRKALEIGDEDAAQFKEGCQGFSDAYAGGPLTGNCKTKCKNDCMTSYRICHKTNGGWAKQLACSIGYYVCKDNCNSKCS
ncbi:MAG TPA: hypothetical protein DCM05_15220 [Elusimicrobia bacterium]|nr:hypothetical protein [Elusimicrobiota bacterium]